MGFMDRAKKLAEQAQQKLDEAQKQFGQGGSEQTQSQQGVRYDQHGRPIEEGPPAGAAPPPSAEPATPPPATESATPAPSAEPAAPPPDESGDANATPDPFKPIQ
jgi:hypothetical protein